MLYKQSTPIFNPGDLTLLNLFYKSSDSSSILFWDIYSHYKLIGTMEVTNGYPLIYGGGIDEGLSILLNYDATTKKYKTATKLNRTKKYLNPNLNQRSQYFIYNKPISLDILSKTLPSTNSTLQLLPAYTISFDYLYTQIFNSLGAYTSRAINDTKASGSTIIPLLNLVFKEKIVTVNTPEGPVSEITRYMFSIYVDSNPHYIKMAKMKVITKIYSDDTEVLVDISTYREVVFNIDYIYIDKSLPNEVFTNLTFMIYPIINDTDDDTKNSLRVRIQNEVSFFNLNVINTDNNNEPFIDYTLNDDSDPDDMKIDSSTDAVNYLILPPYTQDYTNLDNNKISDYVIRNMFLSTEIYINYMFIKNFWELAPKLT